MIKDALLNDLIYSSNLQNNVKTSFEKVLFCIAML